MRLSLHGREQDWKGYEEYCFTAAKGGLMADLDDSVMQRCQAAEVLVQLRSAREMQILRGEVRFAHLLEELSHVLRSRA